MPDPYAQSGGSETRPYERIQSNYVNLNNIRRGRSKIDPKQEFRIPDSAINTKPSPVVVADPWSALRSRTKRGFVATAKTNSANVPKNRIRRLKPH